MAKVNWKNRDEVNKYYRDYFRKHSTSTLKYRKHKNLVHSKTKICTKCGVVLIKEGINLGNLSESDLKISSYQCKYCRDKDNDEREKRRYLTSSKNGHNLFLKGRKRLRGKRIRCEICNKIKRLAYHHWDDNDISKALYLCGYCHIMAEQVDKKRHIKYLQLKQEIENGNS